MKNITIVLLSKFIMLVVSWVLIFFLVIKLFYIYPMIATILILLILGSKFKF